MKPQRAENNDPKLRANWWQFKRPTLDLYKQIYHLDRVLVFAQTSRTQMPTFVSAKQVLSHMLAVIATDKSSSLSLHTSDFQYWWTAKYSAGLKSDLRFFPSDCFENFPQPKLTEQMNRAGVDLYIFRRSVMEQRKVGLTALYNCMHNENRRGEDILRLREIHVEIDEVVRDAYALDEEREPEIREYEAKAASAPLPAWREIELGHGFHETRQGLRFTISAQARADVLDKLLALNHYRYEQEVKQGLHSGKGRGASRKKGAGRMPSGTSPAFDDGGLFPAGGDAVLMNRHGGAILAGEGSG